MFYSPSFTETCLLPRASILSGIPFSVTASTTTWCLFNCPTLAGARLHATGPESSSQDLCFAYHLSGGYAHIQCSNRGISSAHNMLQHILREITGLSVRRWRGKLAYVYFVHTLYTYNRRNTTQSQHFLNSVYCTSTMYKYISNTFTQNTLHSNVNIH